MGCSNTSTDSDEFIEIEKGFQSLIKSVIKEMEGYQNEINELKKKGNNKKNDNDINYIYDQKILQIFHDDNSYVRGRYYRDYFLSENLLNDAKECMQNKDVLRKLNPGVIIKLKAIEKEREVKLREIKSTISDDNLEKYNELNEKIELCKNQIRIYEKEKQAATTAKREEIRNRLLNKSMKTGVFTLYKDRQGYNQAIDENYVERIHNDYNNN